MLANQVASKATDSDRQGASQGSARWMPQLHSWVDFRVDLMYHESEIAPRMQLILTLTNAIFICHVEISASTGSCICSGLGFQQTEIRVCFKDCGVHALANFTAN
jgi:hypothetical protein